MGLCILPIIIHARAARTGSCFEDSFTRDLQASNDDITLLYHCVIAAGKVTEVNSLRKEFYAHFEEEESVTDARFWDSLTTLQYLGFLELNKNEEKVIRLDFALYFVCSSNRRNRIKLTILFHLLDSQLISFKLFTQLL